MLIKTFLTSPHQTGKGEKGDNPILVKAQAKNNLFGGQPGNMYIEPVLLLEICPKEII